MSRINEKLGVPRGVVEEAEVVHKKIMDSLHNKNKKDWDEDGNSIKIILDSINIKLENVTLEEVPIILEVRYVEDEDIPDNTDLPELISMAYGKQPIYDEKGGQIVHKFDKDRVAIFINLIATRNNTYEDLLKELEEKVTVDIIAHEIKHIYDDYKSITSSIHDSADYSSKQLGGLPIIMSKFLHMLYFTSHVENLVRPVELYMRMGSNKINKDNFLEFMSNDDIIKNLNAAINFNLDNFKKALANDPEVQELLKEAKDSDFKSTGDDAIDALTIIFIGLSNEYMSSVVDELNSYVNSFSAATILPNMHRVMETTKNNYERLINNFQKYHNNPQKYFELLIKRIKFTSNKTKKKLYKLYDMAKDSKKSILNWDLHNKINKRGKKNENNLFSLKYKKINNK